jgi:hypothetical protein
MKRDCTVILMVVSASTSALTNWKGVAAAVWLVQPPGLDEYGLGHLGSVGTTVSETDKSNDKEIAVVALNEALVLVEDGQRVQVFVRQTWIVEGINDGAERWEAERWGDRPYKHHWMEYLRICREKKLRVDAEYIPDSDGRFANDIRLFRKWVRAARDKRAKELGTPTAGFDELPD